jgi:TolB-like protein
VYFKFLERFIVLLLLAILAGCKAQPVYNVEDQQFSVPASASLQQVEDAIIKGCKNAGWRPQVVGQGKIIATYSYKRKYSATVDITFDLDSYDIAYRSSSSSLKYTERQGESAENFFAEYNPFDDEETQQPQANGTKITIHKSYNRWVKDLESSINAALAAMPLNMATGQGRSSSSRYTPQQSQPRETVNCDTKPDTTLSGQVIVNRSSANLRYGASSRCPQVGSVHKDETLSLLGAYGNWFYIQTAQNKLGWIYAPLVRKLDSAAQVAEIVPAAKSSEPVAAAATTQTASKEPQPPPPPKALKKKIAIAVIQFKTLNKEAQDIALGDLVSETFTSALVNSSAFKIIERAQLDKVIKEMEFSQTGFIETSNAVEIGKMLHADAIITGSVALLGKKIQMNARIIDIESAYVISAETRTTDYNLENVSKIAREIVASLSQKLNN